MSSTDTEQPSYLIYSHEHRAWWKANRHGYTNNLFEIGIYTRTDAEQICEQANWPWLHGHTPPHGDLPNEVMVPLPDGFFTIGIPDALAGLRESVEQATTAALAGRDKQRETTP